jgi:hypothetical protein
VAESNSLDGTAERLRQWGQKLEANGFRNRIDTRSQEGRWWPYGTSPERIDYLAQARNFALQPLSHNDSSIRLADAASWTKVVFMNDIFFDAASVVRLLASRVDDDASQAGDYDAVCGVDFGWSGLYDSWVARGPCGFPAETSQAGKDRRGGDVLEWRGGFRCESLHSAA